MFNSSPALHRLAALAGIAAAASCGSASRAGVPAVEVELLTDAISNPMDLTYAPGDTIRIFIIERGGKVRLIKNGSVQPTPFLDISSLVSTTGERGLLGIDFHPQYASNGLFFVRYNDAAGNTVVVRYEVSADPDIADPASASMVLAVPASTIIHNGGSIEFGPDGLLYVTLGDGGFPEAAQDPAEWWGKILRLDIDGDDFPADPNRNYAIPLDNSWGNEVFALGLRNPFRMSFDRATGTMWIGDVGQNAWEEVDMHPAGVSGMNFAWPCMEASHCHTGLSCLCGNFDLQLPQLEYDHSLGCAVVGGRVYRGCAIPDLEGAYFFGDFCSGSIWMAEAGSGQFQSVNVGRGGGGGSKTPGALQVDSVVAFGEDAQGEIYICSLGGDIYKIIPSTPGPDGNGDGIPDSCDGGCDPVHGDATADGNVDVDDLLAIINGWGPCQQPDCSGDIAPECGDGAVDVDDLLDVLNNWN